MRLLLFLYLMSYSTLSFADGDTVSCEYAYKSRIYSEAYQICAKTAEQGNSLSQLYFALMHELGEGTEQNYKEAYKWYIKSAQQGNTSAQFNVALLYYVGNGVEKSHDNAINWAKMSAAGGNIDASYLVGDIYFNTNNFEEAISWLTKAAELGSVGAQRDLAQMYYFGRGVQKNLKEAYKWYSKAAEQGSSTAQFNLAMAYIEGDFLAQNYNEAFSLLKTVTEQDEQDVPDPEVSFAQIELANLYYSGLGTEKNLVEAARLYRKAADAGHSKAQVLLGNMYVFGEGVNKDYSEGAKLLHKAAEKNEPAAFFLLGYIYSEGLGVSKDFNESVKWHRKAAVINIAASQCELGKAYALGRGVPKNYVEAVKLFTASALQGFKQAQGKLGAMYAQGQGVDKNDIKALAWLTLGAVANDDLSVKLRDLIEKDMKPEQVAQAQQLAVKFQQNIELNKVQSENYSQLTTDNYKQNESVTPLTIVSPANLVFTANDIAIIIGIEKYRNVISTEYASADASKVKVFLKALGILERNIELLTDERATLSDIRKVIESKLPNMVKTNSRVIVYYAGHGAPGAARGESYLVPYDGDPSFLSDTAYPLSRLYDRLSRLKAKEILVVLDSCFSGAGGRSVLAKGTRPLVMIKDAPPPSSKKMIVLTSARGSQITTSLPEVGHGAFTYFFLRALQEGSRDIGEVYAYLKDRVTEEAKRQNVDQTPTISPELGKLKGRFVFTK